MLIVGIIRRAFVVPILWFERLILQIDDLQTHAPSPASLLLEQIQGTVRLQRLRFGGPGLEDVDVMQARQDSPSNNL